MERPRNQPILGAWAHASDIRTLININIKNGVCETIGKAGENQPRLNPRLVSLHLKLLQALEKEFRIASLYHVDPNTHVVI